MAKLSPEECQRRTERLLANRAPGGKSRIKRYEDPVPKIYDPEDVPEYIDPQLSEYTEKVKRIVKATKEPFTYGYIHRMLGDDARRDLTPTVLKDLDLVFIPGYPEKFAKPKYAVESKWTGNLDEFGKSGVRGSRWYGRS